MKKIHFIILALIIVSCKEANSDLDEDYWASQYYIYNNSSHSIDLVEMHPSCDSILNKYHLSINDSLSILTRRANHTVSPFGAGDFYAIFDDTIKYNCVKHDFMFCWSPRHYNVESHTSDLIVRTYSITDDDYNKIVNILKEEQ